MTKWDIDRLLLNPALALEELNGRTDAEPAAAMTKDYLGCEYVSMDVAGIEKIAAAGSKGPTDVVYLYEAPPAPSVAVKDTSAELKELLSLLERMSTVDCGYSWELRNSRGQEEIRAYGENAKTFKFVIDNRDALISALSAQMQDAAGWRPIDTAPEGASDRPETYFIGARIDGARVSVATCYRNKHGAYEWWGGGIWPTHWMPFPDVKQMGGGR